MKSKLSDAANQNINIHKGLRNVMKIEDQPIIKLINLDLSFARIGTISQILRFFLSAFTGSSNTNDPHTTKTRHLDVLDDFLHKLRQQSQYSIHAQPGLSLRDPDDITSDTVENMVAAKLGGTVYNFHAFIAPWIGIFKMFFPYSENPLMGLLPRLVDSADNAMGKLTNIFWNMRRIGKAFVAYDGGIKSAALTTKQNEVRDVINFYWNQYVKKYLSLLYRSVFKPNDLSPITNLNYILTDEAEQRIKRVKSEMWNNFKNNCKSIIAETYSCAHEGGLSKKVGEEEPQNQKWYVRMKIISKCLGLPAGSLGAVFNGLGIGLNLIGSVFNVKRLRAFSDKCTDWANALMSLVYLTGEVPANLNEYIRKKKYEGIIDKRNLAVFATGVLGMLNRIKILPILSNLLNITGIKPLLDRFDKPLRHCFLLFFSYNRLVLHSSEKEREKEKASHQELNESRRHDNLWSHITLPIRVLMADEQVSYSLKPESEMIPDDIESQSFAQAA